MNRGASGRTSVCVGPSMRVVSGRMKNGSRPLLMPRFGTLRMVRICRYSCNRQTVQNSLAQQRIPSMLSIPREDCLQHQPNINVASFAV